MGRRRRWFLLAFAVVLLAGCGGEYRWSKSFGGSSFVDTIMVGDVAVAPDGAAIVVGRFEWNVNIGGTPLTANGAADIFVARYRTNGDLDWVKQYGAPGPGDWDFADAVALDADGNAYVGGQFKGTATFGSVSVTATSADSDAYIVKITPSGTVAWAKNFGGNQRDSISALAVNGPRVAATGAWTDAQDDVLLAVLNTSDGSNVFAPRHEGGPASDFGTGIAIDAQGTTTVTGTFQGRATIARKTMTSNGFDDIFLAQYNAAGTGLQGKQIGAAGGDHAEAIAAVGGEFVVVGDFVGTVDFLGTSKTARGSIDMFVMRLNANLTPRWVLQYGSDTGLAEAMRDVAVDGNGNAVVTGDVIAPVDLGTGALVGVGGGQDPVLAKIDPNGKTVWAKRFTSTQAPYNRSSAVATGPNNDVVAVGAFFASISLGGTTPHTSVGGNGLTQSADGYITRFAP